MGEDHAHRAADCRDHQRLTQQMSGDAAQAGAERELHRQLLPSPLADDQEQIGDVGARHQEQHRHGAEQHPQHARDISDQVLTQRVHVGREPEAVVHLPGEAGRNREPIRHSGDQPRQIRVGTLQAHAWRKAGHAVEPELADLHPGAIEAQWHEEVGRVLQEAEPRRQHTDDLAAAAINHE